VAANIPANSLLWGGTQLNNSAAFYTQMFNTFDSAPGISRAVPVDNNFDTTNNLGCGDLNVLSPDLNYPGAVLQGLSALAERERITPRTQAPLIRAPMRAGAHLAPSNSTPTLGS